MYGSTPKVLATLAPEYIKLDKIVLDPSYADQQEKMKIKERSIHDKITRIQLDNK